MIGRVGAASAAQRSEVSATSIQGVFIQLATVMGAAELTTCDDQVHTTAAPFSAPEAADGGERRAVRAACPRRDLSTPEDCTSGQ